MSDLIKLTGLWEKTDKNGNPVFMGNLGSSRVVILHNNYKKEDKHPDYNLFIAARDDDKKNEAKPKVEVDLSTEYLDDDIPF